MEPPKVEKYRYLDMIVEAIKTLKERDGSSREAIWKHISTNAKYTGSVGDKKTFLVQLRRILKDKRYVVQGKNKARFILSDTFKEKLVRHLRKGEPLELARKHAMMTKESKKAPPKKNKKVKASKMGKKGQEKLSKAKKAEKTKKKVAKKAKTKDGKASTKPKAAPKASTKPKAAGTAPKAPAKPKAAASAGAKKSKSPAPKPKSKSPAPKPKPKAAAK